MNERGYNDGMSSAEMSLRAAVANGEAAPSEVARWALAEIHRLRFAAADLVVFGEVRPQPHGEAVSR